MEWLDLPMPPKGSTVAVGMSGGVDSTLVALLLKEHGCQVIGITMSTWDKAFSLPPSKDGIRSSCYGPDEQIDINQCKEFCKTQNIPHHVINVQKVYRQQVLEYFKTEYRSGRTPNPCVRCNPTVKFGALLTEAINHGINFDYFCTGHYAKLVRPKNDLRQLYFGTEKIKNLNNDSQEIRPVMISAATDITKDQTYFLCRLSSEVLEKVRFPLANFTKKQVFQMAQDRNLKAASRGESQDFIPDIYLDILFGDKPSVPGDIVDLSGKKLGKHRGIEHYTIGQRRGLGVSVGKPIYVHSIDAVENKVILSEEKDLFCKELIADDWVWSGGYAPEEPFNAFVKIRLASKPAEVRIAPIKDGSYKITFMDSQRAVAPGQAAVVYLENTIMGGGIISKGTE